MLTCDFEKREREGENPKSKTLILKDSGVRSIWTILILKDIGPSGSF